MGQRNKRKETEIKNIVNGKDQMLLLPVRALREGLIRVISILHKLSLKRISSWDLPKAETEKSEKEMR